MKGLLLFSQAADIKLSLSPKALENMFNLAVVLVLVIPLIRECVRLVSLPVLLSIHFTWHW